MINFYNIKDILSIILTILLIVKTFKELKISKKNIIKYKYKFLLHNK